LRLPRLDVPMTLSDHSTKVLGDVEKHLIHSFFWTPKPRSRRSSARLRQRREVVGCFRQSAVVYRTVREELMRYKPKSIAALHIALGGLPVKMRVEVDTDIAVSASPLASF